MPAGGSPSDANAGGHRPAPSGAACPAHIREAITTLLARRQPPATLCPSEAARALAPQDWRPLMPQVRAVAIAMAREGALEIRQAGRPIDPAAPLRGPIRLGHAP